ncbi:uncharacterized protein LOC128986943 [Macrosteles quadrilineatus]|uniref:uncharacterized protein LOC128986943 n=1 Tax=Macrosteles quadrilineatus TaxID=74068 RepID=UPI0023E1BD2A|nr:uncharacterized protein LOC128986943 [Macrosteles quadrilineatus]
MGRHTTALSLGLTVCLVIFASVCYAAPPISQSVSRDGKSLSPPIGTEKDDILHKEAESPKTSAHSVDISKEHSAIIAKTDSIPNISSTSSLNEDKTEEKEENGIIRGKYSYVEDGIPAQLEYEAIPQVKFEVTKYTKGSKILTSPDIIAKSSPVNEKEPEYEHASVISKPSSITRKTRSLTEQNRQSEPTEYELARDQENNETDVLPADASYKFGFSADGQTRNEESDAEGNVEGSYSYIGEDGMITKVEYEAGAGRGFSVKRIIQLPGPVKVDQSFSKLNTEEGVGPSSHGVISEDHIVQSPQRTSLEQQDDPVIENDGSYSFSYATPDQWREESKDTNGKVNSHFYSIIRENKFTQAQADDLTKEFIEKEFKPRMTHFLENIFTTALKENTKTSIEGLRLVPYESSEKSDVANNEGTVKTGVSSDGQMELNRPTQNEEIVEPMRDENLPQSESENNPQDVNEGIATTLNEDTYSNLNQEADPSLKASQNVSPTIPALLQEDKSAVGETTKTNNPDELITISASNSMADGSYNFAYGNNEQLRRESVDTKGNVYSKYQYKTKDGGRTAVVFKRRVVKDSTAKDGGERQFKRDIPVEHVNTAQVQSFRGSVKHQRQRQLH